MMGRFRNDPSGLLALLVMVSLVMLHSAAWAFAPRPTLQFAPRTRIQRGENICVVAAKDKMNSEDEEETLTGMDAAFRQLGALDSLGEKGTQSSTTTVQLDEASKAELKNEAPSLEQQVKLFKGLLEDSEQDQGDLYSDVIKEMGGTPVEQQFPPEQQIIVEETTLPTSSNSDIPPSEQDTQKFMDRAIQEALEDARKMAPGDARKMSDSILDDEEIMKEIEEIFERGNEKLMAGLEEIRQEQVSEPGQLDDEMETNEIRCLQLAL
jgi:hypothetical protein